MSTQPSKSLVLVQKMKEVAAEYGISSTMMEVIKNQVCQGASDDEAILFLTYCGRTRLDPIARQIYCVMRKDWHTNQLKMIIQSSIDGLRLIAERSGKYQGQTPQEWCGPDGVWLQVWPHDHHPLAARCGVYKQGFIHPLYAIAKFKSYCQYKDGKPTGVWKNNPDLMISKCAESLALRKAFPNETSGIYTAEEMGASEGEVFDIPSQSVSAQDAAEAVYSEAPAKPVENAGRALGERLRTVIKSTAEAMDLLAKCGLTMERGDYTVGQNGRIQWDKVLPEAAALVHAYLDKPASQPAEPEFDQETGEVVDEIPCADEGTARAVAVGEFLNGVSQ